MTIRELADILGWEALATLAAERGGQRAYVPVSRAPDWLDGPPGRRLSDLCGGERIDVPTAGAVGRARSRARAEAMVAAGHPDRRVAAETGMSRRTARRIRNALDADR